LARPWPVLRLAGVDECTYPGLAASTAYGRGCRCGRCRVANSERWRRYYEANCERRAEAIRRWRAENQESLAGYNRRWRRDNLQSVLRRERDRRKEMRDLAPGTVTGRYTPVEDRVIVAWAGPELALAQTLGRSWESVRGRKRELRKRGLLGPASR